MSVDVIHFTDPACPWAYSAEPDLNALRYRYGNGLRWRRVMIGLAETHEQYDGRGYKPEKSARSRTSFARRFGMPFRFEARSRNLGTGLPCRAVKAAELQDDDLAEALLRALRFGYFATPLMMDTDDAIRTQAGTVAGLDVDRLMTDLKSEAVETAYQADWAKTLNAGVTGRPMILQEQARRHRRRRPFHRSQRAVRARRPAARRGRLAVVCRLRRDGRQPGARARAA